MFRYSASYFGDPNAQYNLARLYLDGTGVEKDSRLAARWFNLAAEKGHYQAQALLGHLLVNGEGVPRQRTTGLMWLTMARDAADPDRDGWIMALHDKAAASVSDMERQAALSQLEQHLRRRR
jgi:TPR repeat protein